MKFKCKTLKRTITYGKSVQMHDNFALRLIYDAEPHINILMLMHGGHILIQHRMTAKLHGGHLKEIVSEIEPQLVVINVFDVTTESRQNLEKLFKSTVRSKG